MIAQVVENMSADTMSTFVEKTVADKVSLSRNVMNIAGITTWKHFYPHIRPSFTARASMCAATFTQTLLSRSGRF